MRRGNHCESTFAADVVAHLIAESRNVGAHWPRALSTQHVTQQGKGTGQPMDAIAKQHEREHLVAELFGADPATEVLAGRLLRTREVALLFQVSERAVTDWARKGRLPSVRTPGGHRRYPADLVQQLLVQTGRTFPDSTADQR